MTFEIGTTVKGRDVTMGTDVTGIVVAVFYPDGPLRYVTERPEWMTGRTDQDYRCRYDVRNILTNRRQIIECAEAAPERARAVEAAENGCPGCPGC